MKPLLSSATLEKRQDLRIALHRLLIIVALVFGCTIAAGWWNLYRRLIGRSFMPIFALADVQMSVLNFLEPALMLYASSLCFLTSSFEHNPINRRSFGALGVGFIILTGAEIDLNSSSTFIQVSADTLGTANPLVAMLPFLIVPVGALLYLRRFLLTLPFKYACGLLSTGFIYVCGVWLADTGSQLLLREMSSDAWPYLLVSSIEESLEATGIFGFCAVLTFYLRESHLKRLLVAFVHNR